MDKGYLARTDSFLMSTKPAWNTKRSFLQKAPLHRFISDLQLSDGSLASQAKWQTDMLFFHQNRKIYIKAIPNS